MKESDEYSYTEYELFYDYSKSGEYISLGTFDSYDKAENKLRELKESPVRSHYYYEIVERKIRQKVIHKEVI